MSETTIQKSSQLYGAIQLLAQNAQTVPQPFAQELLLLKCHIAGTSYRDLGETEEHLAPDDTLTLCREPHNPHDPHAIAVFDINGTHLGYVPRRSNEVLAKLMDAGKFLHAKLTNKERRERWLKLDIEIYMKEL